MYLVIRSYNFDFAPRPETKAVEFADYTEASAYLHWLWEQDLNDELANGGVDMDNTYHEEDHAQIVGSLFWKTTYVITEVSTKEKEFEKVKDRYVV